MPKIALFDTETDGLLPDLTRMWCAHVIELDKDYNVLSERSFDPQDIWVLPDYLSNFDVLIGHNLITFDLPAIRKVFGVDLSDRKIIDTLLISRTQRPKRRAPKGVTSGPHSVEAWGVRLRKAKPVHEDWTQFSPEMMHRCKTDAQIQLELLQALVEEGRGEGWVHAHKLISRMFVWLQKQEEYGFYVDQNHMEWCLSALNRWIDRIDRVLAPYLPLVVEIDETKTKGEVGYVKKPFKKDGSYTAVVANWLAAKGLDDHCVHGPFSRITFRLVDLDKNKEVKEFLLEQGWQPQDWNYNDNGERTSPKLTHKEEFKGIESRIGKLIAKRVQCKQRRGTIEGWKEAIREDGRISPRVNGMAATGRLRHSVIVNVPNQHAFFGVHMRRMFRAAPGMVLVGVDSRGNQMRQLASRMIELDGVGDEQFNHALLHGDSSDGTDLHSLNMRRSGVPNRTLAKNFFYGAILFGAGDPKTATILDTSPAKAKALKAEYFSEMPLLKALLEAKKAEWRATAQKWWNKQWNRWEYKNGYIIGLDGRPFILESEHTILAYLLQSDEAIQMAVAYVMSHKWMLDAGYSYGVDWGMCLWMHDEFQMETKPEIAKEAGEIMRKAIVWAGEYLGCLFPHDGDIKIGEDWYETH